MLRLGGSNSAELLLGILLLSFALGWCLLPIAQADPSDFWPEALSIQFAVFGVLLVAAYVALFIAIGRCILALIRGMRAGQQMVGLARDGHLTAGRLVDWLDPGIGGHRMMGRRHERIIEFDDETGRTWRTSDIVITDGMFVPVAEGERVDILYAPNDPNRSVILGDSDDLRLEADGTWRVPDIAGFVAAAFIGFVALLVFGVVVYGVIEGLTD
ncbi:MAG: hypothetical protein KC620_12955 [Myxococcales bacterium]|nr:hypothetical protein [Myxococcales bacterium]